MTSAFSATFGLRDAARSPLKSMPRRLHRPDRELSRRIASAGARTYRLDFDFTCGSCGEPVQQDKDQCPWCSIAEDDEHEAAGRNPMRMLSAHGLLEGYYRDMGEIDRRHREASSTPEPARLSGGSNP
jgi:hypothetical protein